MLRFLQPNKIPVTKNHPEPSNQNKFINSLNNEQDKINNEQDKNREKKTYYIPEESIVYEKKTYKLQKKKNYYILEDNKTLYIGKDCVFKIGVFETDNDYLYYGKCISIGDVIPMDAQQLFNQTAIILDYKNNKEKTAIVINRYEIYVLEDEDTSSNAPQGGQVRKSAKNKRKSRNNQRKSKRRGLR
jgi:hypothetical protein